MEDRFRLENFARDGAGRTRVARIVSVDLAHSFDDFA
jgi:hypothetical protein